MNLGQTKGISELEGKIRALKKFLSRLGFLKLQKELKKNLKISQLIIFRY
jgi:ribosomal protein L29